MKIDIIEEITVEEVRVRRDETDTMCFVTYRLCNPCKIEEHSYEVKAAYMFRNNILVVKTCDDKTHFLFYNGRPGNFEMRKVTHVRIELPGFLYGSIIENEKQWIDFCNRVLKKVART